jgi:hypothetical protein
MSTAPQTKPSHLVPVRVFITITITITRAIIDNGCKTKPSPLPSHVQCHHGRLILTTAFRVFRDSGVEPDRASDESAGWMAASHFGVKLPHVDDPRASAITRTSAPSCHDDDDDQRLRLVSPTRQTTQALREGSSSLPHPGFFMQLIVMNRSDQNLVDGDGGVRITRALVGTVLAGLATQELRASRNEPWCKGQSRRPAGNQQRRARMMNEARNGLCSCWVLLLSYGIIDISSTVAGRKKTTRSEADRRRKLS